MKLRTNDRNICMFFGYLPVWDSRLFLACIKSELHKLCKSTPFSQLIFHWSSDRVLYCRKKWLASVAPNLKPLTWATEQNNLCFSCNSRKLHSKGESNKWYETGIMTAFSWCSAGEVEISEQSGNVYFPAAPALLQQNPSPLSSSFFLRMNFCVNSVLSL